MSNKDEVMILKMSDGVEVICKVTYNPSIDIHNQTVNISKPFAFGIIGKQSNGIPQIGFSTYVMSDPMTTHLSYHGSAINGYIKEIYIDKNLVDEYISKSTGIALAK